MDNLSRHGLSAIVEYDYKAKEPDELDLIKGAIIVNIKKQDIGWWEGTLYSTGKTGMFPDNFVRVLNNDDEKVHVVLREKSATTNRRCKVIYSYTQDKEDELTIEIGDIIEVLGEVEEGWWRGKLGDKIGVFPSNFVVPIETSPILINKKSTSSSLTRKDKTITASSLHSSREDLFSSSPSSSISNVDRGDAPLLPPKPIKELCRVLFPYEPTNEDELELQVGEIITILCKELPDKGWWKGELHGKIGVFPDNFVQLLPTEVSPQKDSSQSDRPPHSSSSSSSTKVFIKKSGSASSQGSSNRKDSFGSRDSLNDILSETGIVSGNVVAQRKSLENKVNDSLNNDNNNKITRRSLESKTGEMRKSLENMDEKKTPPPVLTKKPIVPIKKQTTVTSVAGNILSGLKQRVKSVESKLSTHDNLDGLCNSKINSQVAETLERGITCERIRKDDSEFDNVERSSMLVDMRAGRAKAPKRRPPSTSVNILGDNNSIYLNGVNSSIEPNDGRLEPNDSTEELAKPKPREWEKKKAPWMEELKASQAKKTSPNVEPRTSSGSTIAATTTELTSKLEQIESNSNSKTVLEKSDIIRANSSSSAIGYLPPSSSSSLSSSSSSNQQRKSIEISSNENNKLSNSFESKLKKETINTVNDTTATTTKLISNITSQKLMNNCSSNSDNTNNLITDDHKIRPTSLSIRNRSVSPIGKSSGLNKSISMDHHHHHHHSSTTSSSSSTGSVSASLIKQSTVTGTTTVTSSGGVSGGSSNNSVVEQASASVQTPAPVQVNHDNVCNRVMELEQRIFKLEDIVQSQNKIIDELVRTLKDETDKVTRLRSELDKYVQCITQV